MGIAWQPGRPEGGLKSRLRQTSAVKGAAGRRVAAGSNYCHLGVRGARWRPFVMTSRSLNRRPGPFGVWRGALAGLMAGLLAAAAVAPATAAEDRLSLYTYRDTRSLVALVEDAAALIERNGDEAFKDFAQKDSRWLNDDYYIFVYALDGTCLFHPITPELVGQNVMDLKDMNGKPIIRLITDVGRKPEKDASGWVFYLWENQTQITPNWKS